MADKDTAPRKVGSNPDIERYLSIWQRDPKSRVFAPLAEEYRKIGELARAIEVCMRGLQVHPNYVSGRVALGRAFFDKGEFQAAKEQLEMVYEADPENLVAAKTLGEIYEQEGDLDKALLCYRLAFYTTPSAHEISEKIQNLQRRIAGEEPPPIQTADPPQPPPQASAEAPAEEEVREVPEEKEKRSPLESARIELRKSEAAAAGEKHDLEDEEEDRETENDLREEIERLRRIPERLLISRDELEEATDEFFSHVHKAAPKIAPAKSGQKGELDRQSLTELMLRQGYTQRAIKVYEEFMLSDPRNEQAKLRIDELKKQMAEIEREIKVRQGNGREIGLKDGVDPMVVSSLQNWLIILKEGA